MISARKVFATLVVGLLLTSGSTASQFSITSSRRSQSANPDLFQTQAFITPQIFFTSHLSVRRAVLVAQEIIRNIRAADFFNLFGGNTNWWPGRIHVNPASRHLIATLDLRLLVCDYDQTLEENRHFQRGIERRVLYPLYVGDVHSSGEADQRFNDQMSNKNHRFDDLYLWVKENRLNKDKSYPQRDEVFSRYIQEAKIELRHNGPIAATLKLLPRVTDLLGAFKIRGTSFIIVTNDFASIKRIQIQNNGLANYFPKEGVYGLSDSGEILPKDIVIKNVTGSRGLTQSQVAMLGDTPSDVLAAKKAGVLAIAVAESRASREKLFAAGADIVIDQDFRRWEALLKMLSPRAPPPGFQARGDGSSPASVLEGLYVDLTYPLAEEMKNNRYSAKFADPKRLRKLVIELISELLRLYENRAAIGLHPQGFLQLLVTDKVRWISSGGLRLHVSDPDIPHVHQVLDRWHQHTFQSNSLVLAGEVTDRIYDVNPAMGRDVGSEVLRKYLTPLGASNVPTEEFVYVSERLSRLATTGSIFHLPIEDYHAQPDRNNEMTTITLFHKYDFNDRGGSAIALGPKEIPADQSLAVSRMIDQQIAWQIMAKAVVLLKRIYRISDDDAPGLNRFLSQSA